LATFYYARAAGVNADELRRKDDNGQRYSAPTTADLGKPPSRAKCLAGKSDFAGNRYAAVVGGVFDGVHLVGLDDFRENTFQYTVVY